MNDQDRELIEALHRGDRYACDDLVERYSQQIYAVALRLMQHPAEAEEVLQETLISACEKVRQFEGRASLGTWLHRIATNNSLMRLRKKQVPTHPLYTSSVLGEDEAESEPQPVEDWAFNPEMVALAQELRQVMLDAVAALPDALRQAFSLRELEGLSTRETAARLGISAGSVKVRLHRARTTLRTQLDQYMTERTLAEASAGDETNAA